MASTITHAYFIMDVYEKLNTNIKEFLIDQKELLKKSAQSMTQHLKHKLHRSYTVNFLEQYYKNI